MSAKKIVPVRVNPVLNHPEERRLSLDGQWRLRLDPEDKGLRERWCEQPGAITESVTVPGCWQGQGHGDDSEDMIWDFGLEARVFRATYKGTGWYTRSFAAPNEWQGERIQLSFGGVHPSAEVWLNGTRLGENDMPFVPFGFDVTDLLDYSAENVVIVRVHEKNREFGMAFNWQGNWSGLYRGVELTATAPQYLEDFRAYAEVDRAIIRIAVRIADLADNTAPLMLRVSAQALAGDATPITAEIPVSAADVAFDLTVPSPQLWSPDTPSLYRVDVTLSQGDKVLDAQSERIGFVKLSSKGKHFLINDEPYYMRGSGDFISCPETGCPDTDRERWRRKLKALRDYGYNYVRCQSYVYPPEYFDAADEAGVLIQSEMGMLGAWAGLDKWHVHQWPKPTADNYPILKRQWDLIVQRDVNHPSANLYCMSNEYNADCFHFPRIAWECYHATKAVKPTAFVIWTDGGYSEELPGEFINHAPDYEIDGEDGTKRYLFDIVDKPFIQHEFRWWSSFPDVRSMHKYSGAIRPYAADIAVEAAARQGLSHILPDAADMSQRLQLLEAKVKMEVCRRDHASMAGICHFDAMDANLSPQGVINEFYDRKLADSATWQQTNGDTVIISGLDISDRIRIAGESFTCALSVSDFAHPPMQTPTVAWRLLIGKEVAASGEIIYAHEPYTTCAAGEIKCEVPELSVFARATLEATLRDGDRIVTNSWDLWITPAATSLPHSVAVYGAPKYCAWLKNIAGLPTVTAADLTDGECSVAAVLAEVLDDALVQYMRAGGRVILAATEGMLRPHPPNHGYVNYFFTPPANYPPYEDGQNGTIIRNHPILDSLPHEGFADLQFFRMMDEAPPLDLKPFGLDKADPIIRVIHRYPVCRPLAYLLERDYGKGGLIISALNLDQNLPEAQWLLASMCEYSAGDEFNPAEKLSQESLISLKAATALL